jgi:hypothetical protein
MLIAIIAYLATINTTKPLALKKTLNGIKIPSTKKKQKSFAQSSAINANRLGFLVATTYLNIPIICTSRMGRKTTF